MTRSPSYIFEQLSLQKKQKVRALWSDAEPGIFSGIVLGVDRVRGEVRVRYSDGDEKTVRAEYILCRSGSGSRSGGGDTTATILPSSASERESSGGGPATDSPRTAAVSAAASADASGSAALAFGDT